MAVGHGTTATIGGCVIAAGSFPGGYGAYQVIGSGHSPLGNSWFIVGVVFWCVGVAIVIATGSHFVHEWSMTKQKKGGHYTPPKENLPTSNDGAFVVEDEATLEGRVQNFEQNTVPGVDQPTIVRAQGKGTGIFDMANVKQTHILNPDGSVSGQMVISGPGDIITGADSTMILFPDDAPESED